MNRMKRILALIFVALAGYGGYKAFTYFDNNFKYGRMWETPAVRPHEVPILTMDSDVAPFDAEGEATFKASPVSALRSPFFRPNTEVLEQGKEEYFNYCAQCHGKYHDGNGTVGQSFHPLPGDLRSPKVQSMTDGALFKEISYGKPGGRQPALATTIAVPDRWRIIAYVKSLGPRL